MRLRWLVGGLVVVVLVAGGYWFEPWRLFTTREVDERLPVAASADQATAGPTTPGAGDSAERPGRPAARPVRQPRARDQRARPRRQPARREPTAGDRGPRHLRRPGPARLAHRRQVSEDGWRVFDDGRYVDLGELRGNKGNLVYELPRDVDLADYQSVSIWCERFSVSFGAAALVPA